MKVAARFIASTYGTISGGTSGPGPGPGSLSPPQAASAKGKRIDIANVLRFAGFLDRTGPLRSVAGPVEKTDVDVGELKRLIGFPRSGHVLFARGVNTSSTTDGSNAQAWCSTPPRTTKLSPGPRLELLVSARELEVSGDDIDQLIVRVAVARSGPADLHVVLDEHQVGVVGQHPALEPRLGREELHRIASTREPGSVHRFSSE